MKPAGDLGDIVFGLRKRAKELAGYMPAISREFRELADRIELAVLFEETDRPTGPWNALKVRRALIDLLKWCEAHAMAFAVEVAPNRESKDAVEAARDTAMQEARNALAAPPRNCDVFGFEDYPKAREAFLKACQWEGELGCGECRYKPYDCFQAWLMDLAWPEAGESDETTKGLNDEGQPDEPEKTKGAGHE